MITINGKEMSPEDVKTLGHIKLIDQGSGYVAKCEKCGCLEIKAGATIDNFIEEHRHFVDVK